jgi:hypothetical protein
MMHKFSRKFIVVIVGATLVVAGGGAAFAYWSAGGTGTGTGAAGTNAGITVVQTSIVTAMAPGVAAQPLSGNFDNTNSGAVYVTTVTASIASVTRTAGAIAAALPCDATDYTLANPESTVAAQVPAGSAEGSWGTVDIPTIAFNNKAGANQDGCKSAVVNLAYTIA